MKNKGFSLVELIVVIAIMAILVGVAVPVYTSYIEKSRISSDKNLVDEVSRSLLIYSATNPSEGSNGYVILTTDGAISDDDFAIAALKKTFGEQWQKDLVLKYDGWISTGSNLALNYAGSSLDGNEEELLDTIENLSGALAKFLDSRDTSSVGKDFDKFLADNGISTDSQSVANAAVLYVSDTIGKADEEVIVNAMGRVGYDYTSYLIQQVGQGANFADAQKNAAQYAIGNTSAALAAELDSTIAVCASLYASAEAYALAEGGACKEYWDTVDLGEVTFENATQALNKIEEHFVTMVLKTQESTEGQEFAKNYYGLIISPDGSSVEQGTEGPYPVEQNVKAVISALETVSAASDSLKGNLSSSNCFTDGKALDLINTYMSAAEKMTDVENGILVVLSNGVLIIDPSID